MISEGGVGEGVDRRQAESLVIREQLGRSEGYGRSGRSGGGQNGDAAAARVGEEPAAAAAASAAAASAGRQTHSSRAAGSRRERESEWREERSEKRPEADKALHKLRNDSRLWISNSKPSFFPFSRSQYPTRSFYRLAQFQFKGTVKCSVADPDPPDPHVFGLPDPDPDPLVRGIDPDPSIIMQK
jgi:hypothetical protein